MISDDELRPRVITGLAHFGVDILFATRTHRADITLVPYKVGERQEPTLSLCSESAQMLMDELWRNGIRPSDGEGSVGQIGAIKDHLKDMRKIAFNELELRDK